MKPAQQLALICPLVLFLTFISLISAKQILAQVVINEFVVEPNPEWVEFFSASASAEYIRDYWLDDDTSFTDDSGNSSKRRLTNLIIGSQSYPYIEISSFLNNSGDDVSLFDPNGDLIDTYHFDNSPGKGISIGRSPDQTGDFSILEFPTKGSANASSEPDPIPTPTSTPEPTSTPKPISTPTPTPTKKLTPTPTPPAGGQTPTPNQIKEATTSQDILGISSDIKDSETESKEQDTNREKFPYTLPLAITAVGGILLFGSATPFLKEKFAKRKKKIKNEIKKV